MSHQLMTILQGACSRWTSC